MANQEVIHNNAYEKLLTVLGLEDTFEANLSNPVIAGRVDYLRKYLKKVYENDKKQYVYAITLFTLFVENVSLFSQFFIILHMNRTRGILKDTAQQVKYTRNEEWVHAQVGIKIINTIKNEYPELFDQELQDRIADECKEAIKCETNVIKWMLGDYEVEGLNTDILHNFIKKRMIESLNQIGIAHGMTYDKSYDNDLLWMYEGIMGTNMVDFFASRPVDYSRGKAVTEDDLF